MDPQGTLAVIRNPGLATSTPRRLVAQALRRLALPAREEGATREFLTRQSHLDAVNFAEAALDHLGLRLLVDPREAGHVPESGPVIVVANHPCGAIEALALIAWIGRHRPDFRLLANAWLAALPPLVERLIGVDVFRPGSNRAAVDQAEAALRQGQLLIAFPAGEVSRMTWRGPVDGPWQRGFVELARRTGAPVLPVAIRARNSCWFYLGAGLHPRLGTLLLAREALRPATRRIELTLGAPEAVGDPEVPGRTLAEQWRQRLLGMLRRPPGPVRAVAPPIDSARWWQEWQAGELLHEGADGRQLRLCRLAFGSPLLDELGRVRELSFRAVGEGSGKARDHDRHDRHYDHLLLVDTGPRRIVGAYRILDGGRLGTPDGPAVLYTQELFDFGPELTDALPQTAELGRSFVHPDYFRTRALDELWRGIGAWLKRRPHIRWLVGAVSASASLPEAARRQLVAFYARFYAPGRDAARARRPVAVDASCFDSCTQEAAWLALRAALRQMGVSVPTLFKHYGELTEPGGVAFLAFGVDPDFANCIDGLVRVDLTCLKPAKASRWLGLATRPEAIPEPSDAQSPCPRHAA